MRLSSSLGELVARIPGARRIFPGIIHLPGEKRTGVIAAAGLLVDGPEPLLIDAGLRADVATVLRELGIVKRLHLTHLHLDHRRHQSWFNDVRVTCPSAERECIADWGAWFQASGFPAEFEPMFTAWRRSNFFADERPDAVGLEEGADIGGQGTQALVLSLPGHTAGHSGIWFPEWRAALVTDYDMEKFGPWYGNRTSDLDTYESSLRALLARTDIDWFITSHTRGVLDRTQFEAEAARYLMIIREREERIVDRLRVVPQSAEDLVGHVRIYPRSALANSPAFSSFERRMIALHIERLLRRKILHRCADGKFEVR